MKKISVIIPFLNESENMVHLCSELDRFLLSKKNNFSAEVIFVDDGSTDDSVTMLKKQKHENYNAKVIRLSKNYGSHAALRAGILHSTGDVIAFLYADLQDPPELISEMFQKLEQDNDIVWATRNKSDISFSEKLFSKAYASLMQRFAIKNF